MYYLNTKDYNQVQHLLVTNPSDNYSCVNTQQTFLPVLVTEVCFYSDNTVDDFDKSFQVCSTNKRDQ